MKILKILLFIVIFGILVWGFYRLKTEREIFTAEVKKLQETADSLKKENASLVEKIEYFKNPENLVKELRAQLNYKKQGENMIIVIPPKATSTQ
ncbi:MAG: septum formation initiator family protein [Patescibacteria group bacterium]